MLISEKGAFAPLFVLVVATKLYTVASLTTIYDSSLFFIIYKLSFLRCCPEWHYPRAT